MGGKTNAIIAAPSEPAMFKKSVKLGISIEIPVTKRMIITLTNMRFALALGPLFKNLDCSRMSNAANICRGYDIKAFKHTQKIINVTNPLIG